MHLTLNFICSRKTALALLLLFVAALYAPSDANAANSINVGLANGNTSESGGTASFSVFLLNSPTGTVTIPISSSLLTEATVSPSTLVFNSADWALPKPVTATGVDDTVTDGDQAYTVILGISTSTDPSYNNLDPSDVSMVNTDDEVAGIIATAINGQTSEDGASASFSVTLTEQPTSDVLVPVVSSDTTEGYTDVSSLNFTTANWDIPQRVVVTGVDDTIEDGYQTYIIVLGPAMSLNTAYDGLDPLDVTVINRDNEISSAVPETEESQSCFIATAAYGSTMGPELITLRSFRDKALMKNPYGRAFVRVYYRYSPPLADFIASHAALRVVARTAIHPVAWGLRHPGVLLVVVIIAAIMFTGLMGAMGTATIIRRRKRKFLRNT